MFAWELHVHPKLINKENFCTRKLCVEAPGVRKRWVEHCVVVCECNKLKCDEPNELTLRIFFMKFDWLVSSPLVCMRSASACAGNVMRTVSTRSCKLSWWSVHTSAPYPPFTMHALVRSGRVHETRQSHKSPPWCMLWRVECCWEGGFLFGFFEGFEPPPHIQPFF